MITKHQYDALTGRLRLTPRQLDVARLAATGLSSKQMAQELFLGEQSIKFHITNIYMKLHVTNRVQLLIALVRLGIVPCPCCDGDDHEVRIDGRVYVPAGAE